MYKWLETRASAQSIKVAWRRRSLPVSRRRSEEGIKRVYNHAQYLEKKHAAMVAWGAYIAKLTRHLHAVA